MGIEPTFSAWEADVLPLNYTRSTGVVAETYHITTATPSRKESSAASCLRTISSSIAPENPRFTNPIVLNLGPKMQESPQSSRHSAAINVANHLKLVRLASTASVLSSKRNYLIVDSLKKGDAITPWSAIMNVTLTGCLQNNTKAHGDHK
jgi:hypothetical protein